MGRRIEAWIGLRKKKKEEKVVKEVRAFRLHDLLRLTLTPLGMMF